MGLPPPSPPLLGLPPVSPRPLNPPPVKLVPPAAGMRRSQRPSLSAPTPLRPGTTTPGPAPPAEPSSGTEPRPAAVTGGAGGQDPRAQSPSPGGSAASAPTWAATSGAAGESPAPLAASPAGDCPAGPALPAGAGVRRWVYQNQTMPAIVRMIATYMLNRSPRKCSDGSTRSDSSKIRNAEYPVTYSANRPGGLIARWWPSQTRRAASARSKISSYRNVGWNVRYARYPGGR